MFMTRATLNNYYCHIIMNVLDRGEIGDFFVPKGLLVTGGGSSNSGYIVD